MRALPLLALVACGSDRTMDVLELQGDAANGAVVYAARCESCHGEGGAGGTGPALDVPDGEADFVDVVLYGSGTMSGLEDVVTDQEVADLLSFASAGYPTETTGETGGCRSTGCG